MRAFNSQNNPRIGYGEGILRIVIAALVAGALFLLLNQSLFAGSAISRYDGSVEYREKSWVFREEDKILDPALELPAFRHMEAGKKYSISTVLTYDGMQDAIPSCMFFVDHMFCEAYLDGELMFQYLQEDVSKIDHSRSPGNVYASFRMPHDCKGKELTIVFIPALNNSVEFQLPNPFCGDYFSSALGLFRHDLAQNVVAVLFAFVGVASVLFSTLVLPKDQYKEGLFIGIFAILVSCYSLTESDFDFYVISNPYYTYVLDYVSFTLIPIFLMSFLRERLDPDQKPLALAVILIGCAMFVLEMVLHFMGILDMREFLPIIHVVYLTDFLMFFVMMLRMKATRVKKQLVIQMIPILLGIMMDGAVYYLHWQLGTSDSGFTMIGVFCFLAAEFYHTWNRSIDVYTLSEQTREYMQMAFIDALTGIGNRRALEAEIQVIASGKRKFKSILMVSADLNDLKVTNDTMGHAAGDFLIRSAAEVLAGLSNKRCHAFRMGGDEFNVLIYDMGPEEFEECIRDMKRKIEAINSKSEAKLSIALGYEMVKNKDVELAMEKADQKMYLDKARIKELRNQG